MKYDVAQILLEIEAVRIKPIAGLVDIVPTVCGLLGIEIPKNVQGQDLFGRSQGENTSERGRHLFCESLFPTIYKANSLLGIVNDRYKYIQTTRPELYDLLKDPDESNNLVKKQPKRARIMQDKLAQILEQTVRKDSGGPKVEMDPEARKQLEELGYVGGTITEDFSFDQTKADPKDLLKYHLSTQAFSDRGNTYLAKGDYDQAIREFSKAIE